MNNIGKVQGLLFFFRYLIFIPEASRLLPVKKVIRTEKKLFLRFIIIMVAKYENEGSCQLAEIFDISLEMITEFVKISH